MDEEKLLPAKKAADLLGLSHQTLAVWRCQKKTDQPPYLKIGRSVRYRLSALLAWIKKQERAA